MANRKPLTANDPRHGKRHSYAYYGCRCEACTAAEKEYYYEKRRKRVERGVPEHLHGTMNAYKNYLCRCDKCRAVWAEYMKERNKNRPSRSEIAIAERSNEV